MILLGISLTVAGYLAVGYLFHNIIFPETKPDPDSYFDRGDEFGSEVGGNEFTVLREEGNNLRLKLVFGSHAEGPPVHIQTEWDEIYKIKSGNLTLLWEGEERKLGPGDEVTIPRGVPHKPFNPTDEPVECEVVMPKQFVLYLSQVYGFMNESKKNTRPPRIIFQMALSNQYFDSYLGDPPVFFQKTLNFLLIPIARMMGYKSFYERYRI